MFARVHLGYVDGAPRPSLYQQQPLLGQVHSRLVSGVLVLDLWPVDFPVSARSTESRPVACLWRPVVVVVGQMDLGFSGLEKQHVSGAMRWCAQRWTCEPLSYAELLAEARQRENRERHKAA